MWLIPALLAPAVYSIVIFIDKYILEKEVKNYRGMPIYATIMGLVIGTFFWVFTGFPLLSFKDLFLILLAGALTIWGAALYFKAIVSTEASNLIILLQTIPIFVLIISFLFLGETITIKQLVGFFIALFAIVGVSFNKEGKPKKSFQLSSTFISILIVNLLWALSAILAKFVINANSFAKILSFESWGIGLGGIILFIFFPSIRSAFNESIKTVRKFTLVIIFSNEGFFVLAKALTFFAFSLGPTALVSIIGSTQVFFGILYGFIATTLAPSLIKEDISKRELNKKIFFALILFFGIWLIY